MTLEKQGWLGVLYGFVACLALIVLMGHTFKRDSQSGHWQFIGPSSENLLMRMDQVMGTVDSNGTVINLIRPRDNGTSMQVSVGQKLLVNTSVGTNAGAGDIVLTNSTGQIRGVNVAGTTTYNLVDLSSSDEPSFGDVSRPIVLRGNGIGGGKILSIDAVDSCGVGFRCLRVVN